MTIATEAPAVLPEEQAWIPEPPDPSLFGARLTLIRLGKGWNITEAARQCGLKAETWRTWEEEGREPRQLVRIALAIATRTGVDLDWLVYGPNGKGGLRVTERFPTRLLRPRSGASPVRHGDARRKQGGSSRPATSNRTKRSTSRPVSPTGVG